MAWQELREIDKRVGMGKGLDGGGAVVLLSNSQWERSKLVSTGMTALSAELRQMGTRPKVGLGQSAWHLEGDGALPSRVVLLHINRYLNRRNNDSWLLSLFDVVKASSAVRQDYSQQPTICNALAIRVKRFMMCGYRRRARGDYESIDSIHLGASKGTLLELERRYHSVPRFSIA